MPRESSSAHSATAVFLWFWDIKKLARDTSESQRLLRNHSQQTLVGTSGTTPGSCKGLNFQAGLASVQSTPGGKPAPRFDHWHGLIGDNGAGEKGHWLVHIPVRDFTFGGMAGNPYDGKQISVSNTEPWFMPVCEPAMAENPGMQKMMGNK